ncbi:serine/threonine-protein kinase [Sphaerisporangium fuscum]|uniref:serine/threonine-protein kinase n=1 Tax=Sphaerisporangium fuscum TaxID=2835868 RepID=UPI001BDDB746|nr:serine/threonine-protein kinase [Sphaerisporangium fuscum]
MLLAARYRLDEPLGRGGMGEVWQAWDEILDRPVAVKLLLAGVLDSSAAARFRQEAQATARLNHANVVAVHDFGEADGRLFLIMEMIKGQSLAHHLAVTGPLPPDEVINIGAQTAAGLAAAHRQGVIHRDIKPGNLLLTADGTVKVVDFGIARLADQATAALTGTGLIVGTSSYLAPERALGRDAGPASDIYSLGCVLYELLVGCPPFQADTSAALLYQHVQIAPAPPRHLRAGVPPGLDDLLMRLLAKDPLTRPSAEQVAQWLLTASVSPGMTPGGADPLPQMPPLPRMPPASAAPPMSPASPITGTPSMPPISAMPPMPSVSTPPSTPQRPYVSAAPSTPQPPSGAAGPPVVPEGLYQGWSAPAAARPQDPSASVPATRPPASGADPISAEPWMSIASPMSQASPAPSIPLVSPQPFGADTGALPSEPAGAYVTSSPSSRYPTPSRTSSHPHASWPPQGQDGSSGLSWQPQATSPSPTGPVTSSHASPTTFVPRPSPEGGAASTRLMPQAGGAETAVTAVHRSVIEVWLDRLRTSALWDQVRSGKRLPLLAVVGVVVVALVAAVVTFAVRTMGSETAVPPGRPVVAPSSSAPTSARPSSRPSPTATAGEQSVLSDDPNVLLGQLSRALRLSITQGRLDPRVGDDVQRKIAEARVRLTYGKGAGNGKGHKARKDATGRIRDVLHKLADAEQHGLFVATPGVRRLITHLDTVTADGGRERDEDDD